MRMRVGDTEYEASAISLDYSNDMMSGILIETPHHYFFLSDHVEEHRRVQESIDISYHADLSEQYIDPNDSPHDYVVHHLAMLVVKTAEGLLNE